tara:strand:- start:54 stop:1373 length:1320 start_codon:yes stop_codon:yes gene_type:complete
MEIKKIKSVDISTRNLIAAGETRNLVINGDIGAIFTVNIIKLDGTNKESYYDFNARSFTQEFTSKNNLNVTLASNSFLIPILFPADANGETYKILTIASEKDNTEFTNGQHILVKDIVQVGNTSVVIGLDPGNSFINKYTANPPSADITTTGSTVSTSAVNVAASFTLTNANDDTHGFGLRLPPMVASGTVSSGDIASIVSFNIPNTYFYSARGATVDGTISSSTTLTVTSVLFLAVGMELHQPSSGSFSGTPVITEINGNTLTLSSAQSLSDGVTFQCRAYGTQLIKTCFGYSPELNNFAAKNEILTTTVRTNTTLPESTGEVTLPLNGTRGISVGSRFFGLNVNSNNNNNVIQTVTPSATAGAVTLEFTGGAGDYDAGPDDENQITALTVAAGSKLEIRGSARIINITGNVVINKFPSVDTKILLDLTKLITHGTAT